MKLKLLKHYKHEEAEIQHTSCGNVVLWQRLRSWVEGLLHRLFHCVCDEVSPAERTVACRETK